MKFVLGSALAVLLAAAATANVGARAFEFDAQGVPTAAPELLFDQAKRSFDNYEYDATLGSLDRLVNGLTAGGQMQKPELLAQAYELRARTKYALGDASGVERDFSALLLLKPSATLTAGNAAIKGIFESMKKLTVGQLNASLTPPGDIDIDGKTYSLKEQPQIIDLSVGERTVTVKRPGYATITRKVSVLGGEVTPLELTLERISSTLAIVSNPPGVEVILDGTSRGVTARAASGNESAPLVIGDLQVGAHRLQLRRECYTEVERQITIEKPADLTSDPVTLTPAVASVKVVTSAPNAFLFVDGQSRGKAPMDLNNLCAGPHLIEVRGPKGRFIDRRDWRSGDSVTLTAELRSAFPIVTAKGSATLPAEQLRTTVERLLAPVKGVLVYTPTQSEVDAALREEGIQADWLSADTGGSDTSASRLQKTLRRSQGQKLATRLQVQGLAAVLPGPDQYTINVLLLAAGSGEPDVVTINTADPASQSRAVETLSAPLPPLVKPSLETSFIDVAGVAGAVVVRPAGAGAKAGLAVGDVVVTAGGKSIASVADLNDAVRAARPAAALALDVKNVAGASRSVSVTVATVPDAVPLQQAGAFNNRDLVELQDAVQAAATPVEKAATHISLGIVHMRLGNYDEALAELRAVQLPDGPGVSAGTVQYLIGRCLEEQGRIADARAAYTKAAASPLARLSAEGPLVATLSQQRLRGR